MILKFGSENCQISKTLTSVETKLSNPTISNHTPIPSSRLARVLFLYVENPYISAGRKRRKVKQCESLAITQDLQKVVKHSVQGSQREHRGKERNHTELCHLMIEIQDTFRHQDKRKFIPGQCTRSLDHYEVPSRRYTQFA